MIIFSKTNVPNLLYNDDRFYLKLASFKIFNLGKKTSIRNSLGGHKIYNFG